jgi:hypothetical protein
VPSPAAAVLARPRAFKHLAVGGGRGALTPSSVRWCDESVPLEVFTTSVSPVWLRGGPVGNGVPPTGLWAECGGVGCRDLRAQFLTGTLPTELGLLTALTWLCVRRPHPPCLDTCAVTGLWAERGGGAGFC